MRRAYNQAGLGARVVQGAVLEAEGHRERLDFGVANGRVVQITQASSSRSPTKTHSRNTFAPGDGPSRRRKTQADGLDSRPDDARGTPGCRR